DAWSIILFVLGYLLLALVALRILCVLYNIFVPYVLCGCRRDLHARAGAKWAVITGATDGIGKAYAMQLAEQNFNVFLISRTQSKLNDTMKEISTRFPSVKIMTRAFDFTAPTYEDYQPLINELSTIKVGILVNNVGMALDCPEVLHEVEGGRPALARISTVNTLPVLMMSSAVLEQMVTRKKGVIINVTSGTALNEMAYWNVYSAGKHLKGYVGTLHIFGPMQVETMSFLEPSPEKYVRSALRTVGVVSETTGYISHQIQVRRQAI
ncbi:hypothetical protein PFISCL1PPCAC_12945, partial [Pristionchus fissidentatus]